VRGGVLLVLDTEEEVVVAVGGVRARFSAGDSGPAFALTAAPPLPLAGADAALEAEAAPSGVEGRVLPVSAGGAVVEVCRHVSTRPRPY
jgi:hypothetical protein